MPASGFRLNIYSFKEAQNLYIEVTVEGEDADFFIETLEPSATEADIQMEGRLPQSMRKSATTKVYPFREMTEDQYASWVREKLRLKLAELWSVRW